MSYSTLYALNADVGIEYGTEFKNSWLFAPLLLDALNYKYNRKLIESNPSYMSSYISYASEYTKPLFANMRKNESEDEQFEDMIVWMFTQQFIFRTSQKEHVIEVLRNYHKRNEQHFIDSSDKERSETFKERNEEIIAALEALDADKTPFFVFNNTSVSDLADDWYWKYNEESDDSEECLLIDNDDLVLNNVVFVDIPENRDMRFRDMRVIKFKEYFAQ